MGNTTRAVDRRARCNKLQQNTLFQGLFVTIRANFEGPRSQ